MKPDKAEKPGAKDAPRPSDVREAAAAAPHENGFVDALKQRLEETRLPPELMDQILAELPPPEEQERLYRELMENGGLSSEEFFASLGIDYERRP